MLNKKGQIFEGLQNLIPPLIGVCIILVIGFLVLAETQDKSISLASSGIVRNETVAWTNWSFVALDKTDAMELSCLNVYDAPAGAEVDTGNYTCAIGGINMTDLSGTWNKTHILVSYTYKNKSYAFNASQDTQNATQQIPGWLSIIVITVIGALLISLVSAFRKR